MQETPPGAGPIEHGGFVDGLAAANHRRQEVVAPMRREQGELFGFAVGVLIERQVTAERETNSSSV